MKTMHNTLNAMHHQGNDWKRELAFYVDELAILTKRLEEASVNNTSQDILAQVEHFQNKFIILRARIDELNHSIQLREDRIEHSAVERPEHIDEKIKVADDALQMRMADFTSNFASSRLDFYRMLSKIF